MNSYILAIALCLQPAIAAYVPITFPRPLSRAGSGPYSYDTSAPDGPPNWGSIQPSFSTCSSGTKQSGIDYPCPYNPLFALLKTGSPSVSPSSAAVFTFANTTSNWALNCDSPGSCGTTRFQGVTYSLINLHFHAPSEHTVKGVQYPLEAHMVHQASDGSLLVIGTLFSDGSQDDCLTVKESQSGQANVEFGAIVSNVINGDTSFVVDVASFIGSRGYCEYDGSLTTPPCSEGVTWLTARMRQNVVGAQIAAYESTTGSGTFGNARPTQPLNGRVVKCYTRLP